MRNLIVLAAALVACDSANEADGSTQSGQDARPPGDARRPVDARSTDARPPTDARLTVDSTVPGPDAAAQQACTDSLPQRCFTPAGSLPMGQTAGVVIRAVRWEGQDRVLLQHRGNGNTVAEGWSLCNGRTCANLPSLTLESGRWTIVHVDAAGADQANEVFLGVGALPLADVGEVALYRTPDEAQRSAGTLERFVAWGAAPEAGVSRVADAVGGGRWVGSENAVPVCLGAVGLVVVGASDRHTGYRAQPDTPAACGDGFL